jgi:FolB domain-containing protein
VDRITIQDLAVSWRLGVTDKEQSRPQKILLTIGLELDTASAGKKDDLALTIDYHAVAERVRQWGRERRWKLIESVAEELAKLVLAEFKPAAVEVEVKKFILPDAAHVSVKIKRERRRGGSVRSRLV